MLHLFGRRHKAPRNPTPPWLKWMLIFVVLYALFANVHQGPGGKVRQAVDKVSRDLHPSQIINLPDYKNKIFPGGVLNIKDIAPGKGNPAVCGQELKLAYETFSADDKPTGETASKDKPYRFRLGHAKDLSTLENAVMGMLPGGKRSVVSGPEDKRIRYEIELLDITPALPTPDSTSFRVIESSQGSGVPVSCGQSVSVQFSVWSMEGKKLYETPENETLFFTLGKSEIFSGLEQGVLGIRTGGTRTLIVPPLFQKTLQGNKPVISIPFPPVQTVLVYVTAKAAR